MSELNRRDFLKWTGLTCGSLIAAKILLTPQPARAADLPLVNPKDGNAQAIKYVEDFKKVPTAKGNHCSTCAFYKKAGSVKGKETGTCIIFPGKWVYGEAYCNSWAKKS